jgi:hypothetical protein
VHTLWCAYIVQWPHAACMGPCHSPAGGRSQTLGMLSKTLCWWLCVGRCDCSSSSWDGVHVYVCGRLLAPSQPSGVGVQHMPVSLVVTHAVQQQLCRCSGFFLSVLCPSSLTPSLSLFFLCTGAMCGGRLCVQVRFQVHRVCAAARKLSGSCSLAKAWPCTQHVFCCCQYQNPRGL